MTLYVTSSDKSLFSYEGSSKPKTDTTHIILDKDTKWGFKKLPISMYWSAKSEDKVDQAIQSQLQDIQQGDIIFTQYPLYVSHQYDYKFVSKAKLKGAKVIALVHDIDRLRGLSNTFDIDTLNRYDVIIINSVEFIHRLIPEGLKTKYVIKEFWDFTNEHYIYKDKPFDSSLLYAGNLVEGKSTFLSTMDSYFNDIPIKVWGENKDNRKFSNNVDYKGKEIAENLLDRVTKGIGLIYDGEAQNNAWNSYNKYNTSYKSGLYLSAGIPWLVRRDTHLGDVCQRYNIGGTFTEFTPEGLQEGIRYIKDNYQYIEKNLRVLGERSLKGQFLLESLDTALALL